MATKKSTGDKLAEIIYGTPKGAAFGITPMIGKRREDRQDREAAKSFPVDLARGVVAGAAGMPGDIESLIRMLPGFNEETVLPTSEDVLKRIPFGTDTPAGQFASGLGILGGGSLPVGPAIRGAKALPGALKTAARNVSTPSTLNPQAGVIKLKGGNWLGGNIMGNIDENVKRLRPYKKAGAQSGWQQKELEGAQASLERLKNDKYTLPQMVQAQQNVVDNLKKKVAINNWVESNLGKYVKNQMGTPEDPVRLMFDKRTKEIEAKFAKDMERAKRFEDRALDEPDPRRQANFLREAEQLRNQAVAERSFAMEHITHVPGRLEDYSPEADSYLKQRRVEAGFPAEGMGESEMAKRWETLTDDAIMSMRAGDVQETKNILAQAQDAERAVKTLEPEILRRFEEHIRSVGLDDSAVSSMMRNTPMMDKAAIIGDIEYQNLRKTSDDLSASLRRDEYAAGQQNPFIDKLDPDTLLYSGNTADMGFDHVIDVIKQDVAEGRIRPEQLSKVSMEDAVRRTAEYDQEMAKRMRETALKNQEGFPLYKEYPEGYRWIELTAGEKAKAKVVPLEGGGWTVEDATGHQMSGGFKSKEGAERALAQFSKSDPRYKEAYPEAKVKALEDALKYEGDTMGHCVGGYCPDVLEGRSRIYSLRDAKGEPHVTVETEPRVVKTWDDVTAAVGPEEAQKLWKEFDDMGGYNMDNTDAAFDMFVKQKGIKAPDRIVQIKGKQNAAPKDTYLPFVQDFVRSGQWSDVGDLGNTGLYKADPSELGMFIPSDPRLKSLPGRRTEDFEKAKQAGLFGDQKYFTRSEWEDILRKQIESESGPLPPLPDEGMAHGGRVHFSDNPDVMQLELAGGGLVKGLKAAAKAAKTAAKPVKGTQDVLPAAEREENLQKFLGNSRIRERLYHATPKDFKQFKPGGDDPTMSGPAIWLTPDATKQPAAHNIGSRTQEFREGVNVMPVHVQARSPLMLDDKLSIEWARDVFADGSREFPDLISPKTIEELKKEGYDSIIHADPYGNRDGEQEIIMFEPNKIKSAIGNRGTYDIEDPDITKAAGGAVQMSAGGALARLAKVAKAAKEVKEAAVPLTLPRVRPTTKDIMEAAERVGKQQAGEFVRSPLLKDTTNLAGRSKREFDRLKKLDYKVTPIKDLPEMKPYEAKIGEVNIALPGDQTISDMLVESVDDMPIGVISEGGANFGRGRLSDPEETRAFWASNIGPAGSFQRKVTELARLYDTDMVTAYHLAMGQTSNNFAQHLAEANMKAIDYSKLDKPKMNRFDSEIAAGTFKTDKKTGERIYTTFPEWPGIANPEEALEAMKKDPELRKWFNDRMKTLKSTKPSDLPNAKSIEYAMTEPDIRDLEINMTGLSAGRMKPGAELIPDSAHQTYSHDIPGTALGRAPELSPFSISFPDATAFVRENYRAPDFTGTIQKVFPHQVVDEAYLEDMYKYYTQLRKVRGFKKGGEVKNQNNEQQVQNPVHFTENPDAMRLALTKRN